VSKNKRTELNIGTHSRGLWVLSPLLVFFVLYLATSIVVGDFYKMPVTVAFMAACTWAFVVCRPRSFAERIERFSRGAAHSNIMMMVWIFVLAGAFAQSAKYIGSVDATVNLTLSRGTGCSRNRNHRIVTLINKRITYSSFSYSRRT
jgi:Na+/H+ antiporter NhaC